MGCLITNPSQEMFAEIGIMRGREQAQYDEQTQRRANRLVRHFQQSLGIAQRLQSHHFGIAAFEQFLNSQKEAVFICDEQGRLLQHNNAAERCLQASNLLKTIYPNHLLFIDSTSQKKFDLALSQISVINTDYSFIVTNSSGVFKVRIQPWMHAQTHSLGVVRSSAAMMYIYPLRCAIDLALCDLISHYAFTKAEAEVVQALCRGTTLQEIAAMRNASIHTVRQQVKTCLQKTGTRSQAELVSKVLVQHLD